MMGSKTLLLHSFLPRSLANGPGERAVIWVQGCSLGCPGCFNPHTHPRQGGERIAVEALVERLAALPPSVEGLTVSGGEPFQQRPALLRLLQGVRARTRLSVVLFTGFTWEELQRFPETAELLACVDVLLAGRYQASQRVARGLLGSANKGIHFLTGRYSLADLEAIPTAEVVVTGTGEILFSGIDPLRWEPATSQNS